MAVLITVMRISCRRFDEGDNIKRNPGNRPVASAERAIHAEPRVSAVSEPFPQRQRVISQRVIGLTVVSVIAACIGIFSVFYWFQIVETVSIADLLKIRAARLLLLPLLTMASMGGFFVRWQLLLRVSGQRIPIRSSLSIFLAGLLGIATVAHLGELLRCLLLRRRFGTRLRVSVPVLLLGRLYDILAISTLVVAAAASRADVLLGCTFVLAALLGAVMLWAVAPALGFTRAGRRGFLALDAVVPAMLLSLGSWLVAGLVLYVAATALGAALPVAASARVFWASTLIGGAAMVPAGVGVTGSIAIVGARQAGLEPTTAIAAVTLMRLATTGTALLLGAFFLWREYRGRAAPPVSAPAHFDQIAEAYNQQWSPHMWDLLIERKLGMICDALPPPGQAGAGLDLGCGLGLQTAAMRARGYQIVGVDPSEGLLRHGRARAGSAPLHVGSALDIPFPAASFDFVYMIGVMHHLPGRAAQDRAMREIHRVLKPGGTFLIHDSNPRNPLFKLYMSYVFPLLKLIDDGTEFFVDPRRWSDFPGFALREVRYFTFLPDFMPRLLMKAGVWLERMLEQGPTRAYSAHYLAVMRRIEPAPASLSHR